MGSELSCPCGNRIDFEDPNPKKKQDDIIQEINLGRLQLEELTYEYTYAQTKSCLIKTEQLEGFFKNKQLLMLPFTSGYNNYYNIFFLTNFGPLEDTLFILLQFSQNIDDKSFRASMIKTLNVTHI
jgi:hypothetical protein